MYVASMEKMFNLILSGSNIITFVSVLYFSVFKFSLSWLVKRWVDTIHFVFTCTIIGVHIK